mgnify:CR=1 FL=1|jgi:phosphate transport system substrate-binding protein
MKGMRVVAVLVGLLLGAAPAWAESIKVAGAGGMISLVTELARAYMKAHPGDVVEVMQRSIHSKGGIMGTHKGRQDVGMSVRPLTEEERLLGLVQTEIARVATVVGVNAATVKVKGITSQQLCDIYSGKLGNWKALGGHDAPIRPFTRPEADATKKLIRKYVPCFRALEEAPDVVVMPRAGDMTKALMHQEDAVGFSDMVAVKDSGGKIRPLALDGLAPTKKAIATGKWPIVKRFMLITKGKPRGLAKRFIQWVKGPQGRRIINASGAVAVR